MHDVSQLTIAEIDSRKEAWIAILRQLVFAQGSGEAAVQAVVGEALRSFGATVECTEYIPANVPLVGEFASEAIANDGARVNLLARLDGTGGGRDLLLFAHPDSEAVTGVDRWTQDPFAGVISEGRLYGWGIGDDLTGIAAGIAALDALQCAGVRLAGNVTFASTPSKNHARGVAAALAAGLTADAALYLHPAESGAGLGEIKAFAAGQIEFRITASGRKPPTTEPGHTAFAHKAINPVDKAFAIYAALKELDRVRGDQVHHPLLHAAIGRSTNLQVSQIQCGDSPKLSRLSETCILGGAISFPPTERLSDVQNQVAEAIERAVKSDEWLKENPPVLEWRSGISAVETPQTHPLYVSASKATSQVTGVIPYVNPLHTASDIRNPILQKGIATIGLGCRCGDLTQSGFVDEWVDVEDYIKMIKVVALTMIDWVGVTHAT